MLIIVTATNQPCHCSYESKFGANYFGVHFVSVLFILFFTSLTEQNISWRQFYIDFDIILKIGFRSTWIFSSNIRCISPKWSFSSVFDVCPKRDHFRHRLQRLQLKKCMRTLSLGFLSGPHCGLRTAKAYLWCLVFDTFLCAPQ